jgi:hypothetical protein
MELERNERKGLRRSAFLTILCGTLPAIIIVVIWGCIYFVDERSPLYGFLWVLYVDVYPFVQVGIGILLFLFIFWGLKILVNKTNNRKLILNLTLSLLSISVCFSLIDYILLRYYYSINPFSMAWLPLRILFVSDLDALLINPIFMIWHVITNIVALGFSIILSLLFWSLSRNTKVLNVKLPIILYLSQIANYIFYFLFLLGVFSFYLFGWFFWLVLLLCGVSTSLSFISSGITILTQK